MESLPVNPFDLGVAAVFLIAALIGLATGFVKGGLFVMAWIGAGLATLYGFPFARPMARQMIETTWIADIAAGIAVFVVTLVVLSLIGSLIGSWVRSSRLNALDRSLGMVAGLGTAAVVISAAYGAALNVWPPAEHPDWVRDARTRPWVERGAHALRDMVPDGTIEKGADLARDAGDRAARAVEAEKALRQLLSPTPPATAGDGGDAGYDSRQRRAMDRLIEGSQ